jgi:ribose transport system ATP-binding protein
MAAGIVLLPGDRQGASGIGSVTLTDNLFLPDVARFFEGGWLRRRRMNRDATAVFADYEVRPPIPTLNLASLSGGNAQKVLLAKWLKLKPKLVLLEEPTQGVDVGARQALLRAVRAAADGGAAVLCASSDHEQLADLCDRVLVFGRGRVLSSLAGEALTKERIGERCYGAHDASPAA